MSDYALGLSAMTLSILAILTLIVVLTYVALTGVSYDHSYFPMDYR